MRIIFIASKNSRLEELVDPVEPQVPHDLIGAWGPVLDYMRAHKNSVICSVDPYGYGYGRILLYDGSGRAERSAGFRVFPDMGPAEQP